MHAPTPHADHTFLGAVNQTRREGKIFLVLVMFRHHRLLIKKNRAEMENQDQLQNAHPNTEPTPQTETAKNWAAPFLRLGYYAFVLLAIYHLFLQKDIGDAVMNLGVALIFDPFDQNQTWAQRPIYQRAWLIVHLTVMLGLFIWMLAS
jgi:hypothetical protein